MRLQSYHIILELPNFSALFFQNYFSHPDKNLFTSGLNSDHQWQEQYESLTNEIEVLHERVLDLEVEKRLVIKDLELYSDEAVRGANADQFLTLDENDGWE